MVRLMSIIMMLLLLLLHRGCMSSYCGRMIDHHGQNDSSCFHQYSIETLSSNSE
jgi:hypothetical protein